MLLLETTRIKFEIQVPLKYNREAMLDNLFPINRGFWWPNLVGQSPTVQRGVDFWSRPKNSRYDQYFKRT